MARVVPSKPELGDPTEDAGSFEWQIVSKLLLSKLLCPSHLLSGLLLWQTPGLTLSSASHLPGVPLLPAHPPPRPQLLPSPGTDTWLSPCLGPSRLQRPLDAPPGPTTHRGLFQPKFPCTVERGNESGVGAMDGGEEENEMGLSPERGRTEGRRGSQGWLLSWGCTGAVAGACQDRPRGVQSHHPTATSS